MEAGDTLLSLLRHSTFFTLCPRNSEVGWESNRGTTGSHESKQQSTHTTVVELSRVECSHYSGAEVGKLFSGLSSPQNSSHYSEVCIKEMISLGPQNKHSLRPKLRRLGRNVNSSQLQHALNNQTPKADRLVRCVCVCVCAERWKGDEPLCTLGYLT